MISVNGGGHFDYSDPLKSDYSIADIAHALSNLSRFNGHTREFYSIAEHSIVVSTLYSHIYDNNVRTRLFALLHDAAEAFISDIPKPLKNRTYVKHDNDMITMNEYETILMHHILQHLELDLDMDKEKLENVKFCDRLAVIIEAQELLSPTRQFKRVWGPWIERYSTQVTWLRERLRKGNQLELGRYRPVEAEEEFINLYNSLRWQI